MIINSVKPFTNFRANNPQTTQEKKIKEAQYKGFMAGLAFCTLIGGGYTYLNDTRTDKMLNDMTEF